MPAQQRSGEPSDTEDQRHRNPEPEKAGKHAVVPNKEWRHHEGEQPNLTGPCLVLVHDRSLIHRDDGFWSRWSIAKRTVWPFLVVMLPPLFDQNLGLLQRIEDLAVEQLVSQLAVE